MCDVSRLTSIFAFSLETIEKTPVFFPCILHYLEIVVKEINFSNISPSIVALTIIPLNKKVIRRSLGKRLTGERDSLFYGAALVS